MNLKHGLCLVRKLTKLKELISLIQNDDTVKRFKQLEDTIDHNKEINETFKELLELQKQLVQGEESKDSRTESIRQDYQNKYDELTSFYVLNEYLDLLELINNDLQLITSIIENEINLDFMD